MWLFETFLKAMGGHKHVVIVTYQNLTITIAVDEVCNGSYHRFCM